MEAIACRDLSGLKNMRFIGRLGRETGLGNELARPPLHFGVTQGRDCIDQASGLGRIKPFGHIVIFCNMAGGPLPGQSPRRVPGRRPVDGV